MNLSTLIPLSKVKVLLENVGCYQCEQFRRSPAGKGDEKSLREFVSEVDINSECRLKAGLHALMPEAEFFGEETERSRNHDGFTWVVDPLDGTTNYLSGFEWWCIAVGLVRGQEPVAGFVYRPYNGDFFHAWKGEGAFYNGQPLASAPPMDLKDALIVTGFPYRSPHTAESFYACAESILRQSRGIRRVGSAALELCAIAAGHFQGFWEVDLQAYDVAASLAVLTEAGCRFGTFKGNPYLLFESDSITVGRPGVYETLVAHTSRHYLQG